MSTISTALARAAFGKSACVEGLHGWAASRTRAAAVPFSAPLAACNRRASERGVSPAGPWLTCRLAPPRSRQRARAASITPR